MTPEVKAAVVAELEEMYEEEEGEIVVVKNMTDSLTNETLLRLALGNQTEVRNTKMTHFVPTRFPTLYRNLKLCVEESFPGSKLEHNNTGRPIGGERFKGSYYTGLVAK